MDETPLSDLFKPIEKEILAHQLALGRLCWNWAVLDRSLNEILSILLGVDAAKAACIATEIDSVAGRARLSKKLIHTQNMPDWWNSLAIRCLHRIENQLAPLRNRCIHDAWTFLDGDLVRTDRRAFLKKLEAHSSDTLVFDLKHTMPAEDLDALIGDTFMAVFALRAMSRDIEPAQEGAAPALAKSLLSAVSRAWDDELRDRQLRNEKNQPQPRQ